MGVEMPDEIWRVAGGARNGGIIVRTDKNNSSPPDPVRLSTGALVQALECDVESGRLHYALVSGEGPASGWVAMSAQGRELLVRAPEARRRVRPSTPPRQLPARRDPAAADLGQEEKQHVALERYSLQLAGNREEPIKEVAAPAGWAAPGPRAAATVEVSLRQGRGATAAAPRKVGDMGVITFGGRSGARRSRGPAMQEAPQELAAPAKDEAESKTCILCALPCGEVGYTSQGGRLHAECAARLALKAAKDEEKERRDKEAAKKRKTRLQYGIGWKTARIPRNSALAVKWPVPKGTCCLKFEQPSRTVHLAPTGDPATSVNLEYLALALKVRRLEGTEPLFSLDPKAGLAGPLDHSEAAWQTKRFEPAWLATTSVGEVMFQADVYLKELSMGEHLQPAVGMRSCLDLTADSESWNAREWFVVNKAGVQLVDGSTLMPCVEMGVEAREQIKGPEGMEDSLITRADHPLVKYAEDFTHRFDVIAERRSAVYHLRELAKASVLAKFLIEADVTLEDQWFEMADCMDTISESECIREIPQLWNKRCYSQIRMQDGGSIDVESSLDVSTHGVYGGVQFGLDRFEMGAAAVTVSGVSTRVTPLSTARYIDQPHLVPFKGTGRAAARGVDLNLERFEISEAVPAAPLEPVGRWGAEWQSAEPSAAFGSAFWKHLSSRETPSVFGEKDARLLRALFNPHLSDRREEGELFIPPDTSGEYVERLSRLIEEEEATGDQRQELFLSADFPIDRPGAVFPSSWTSPCEITKGHAAEDPRGSGCLHPRPDYLVEKQRFRRVIDSAAPFFDKRTEDGTRFRIYEVGTLQVRTIQEHDGEEAMRAFFSTTTPNEASATTEGWSTSEDNMVVRVTQYVEAADGGSGTNAWFTEKLQRPAPSSLRFYVVLETELGDCIVTEKRGDRAASWTENPTFLDARNSLAKVTRSLDTSGTDVTIRHFKSKAKYEDVASRISESKHYAEAVFGLALTAWEKSWAELSEPQSQAMKALGVAKASEWFEGKAQAFKTAWQELSHAQREAVLALGFDDESWAEMVAWSHERETQKDQWQQSGLAPRGPALATQQFNP